MKIGQVLELLKQRKPHHPMNYHDRDLFAAAIRELDERGEFACQR